MPGSARSRRRSPVTTIMRFNCRKVWLTQPSVLCQSRTLRHVSNSAITSTGSSRRV
jgi:hypothetical protein